AQAVDLVAVADEQRLATDAVGAHQRPRERLVAPAEEADQDRDEDRRRDVEPERREVLAGADREREREGGDEDDRRHDPARALAKLGGAVEAVAREDEQNQQDQERQPVGLVLPKQVPENRLRVPDQRA